MGAFLISFPADETGPPIELPAFARRLRPGLYLAAVDTTTSRLYHHVKRELPEGTALLVAPLSGRPKFKGMDEGAFKWAADAIPKGKS